MRSRLPAAAMVVAMCTLFGTPARADQIALTAGVIEMLVSPSGSAIGSIRLAGDRGFTFIGNMAFGFTQPVGDPLPPGATVVLRGSANGLDLGGTVTLDGITYTGIGGLDSTAGGSLKFVTTPTLPSVLAAPASVTAPFTLDLLFSASGQPDHSLLGSGIATISLGEDKGFGVPSWLVTAVRADVSSAPPAVPEPATLLMAASGLAWVAMRRRRNAACTSDIC